MKCSLAISNFLEEISAAAAAKSLQSCPILCDPIDRGGQEDKRGESKGERQIQPVISSLSVLHSLEHTKRFIELGREEKGEGGKSRPQQFYKCLIFLPPSVNAASRQAVGTDLQLTMPSVPATSATRTRQACPQTVSPAS